LQIDEIIQKSYIFYQLLADKSKILLRWNECSFP